MFTKMKMHFIKYVLAGALLVAGSSCGEKFLETDYYNILPSDFMYDNEANVLAGLNGIYDTFYPDKNGEGDAVVWGLKPQVFIACHPTLDCQASGWDNELCRHEWRADKDMFLNAWQITYSAISRINRFMEGLESVEASLFAEGDKTKKEIEAEVRGIRAYNYFFLAKTYGRVPMLKTGETYSTTPSKPRPETMQETYDLIIEDFKYAADILDWRPYKNQYGRITKGMCKAYLAQVYMYLEDFQTAKGLLEEIINSNVYSLNPCYGMIFNYGSAWTSESVWEVMYPMHADMGWGATGRTDAAMWYGFMCATPEHGGWGSLYISHEFVNSFEDGDKRKQYSVVAKGETNPFTNETVGVTTGFTDDLVGGEKMPNNYSLKYWRHHPGSDNIVYDPISLQFLRYAQVLLDYAECCFQTADAPKGWEYIEKIRDRAWGNLETTLADDAFVLPLNRTTVPVPDAQAYYTEYKAEKGYTSEVWKVALAIERRHEFSAEFSLYQDLCRMGIIKEFLDNEYPIGQTLSNRQFTFDPNHMIFPIPTKEILANEAITNADQNPGY
jgi:tetratricopeptide (TPR) repeat protein